MVDDQLTEHKTTVNVDEDAAILYIFPDMTASISIPNKCMSAAHTDVPPHVSRIFELSLCATATDVEDQQRFWKLVHEIAMKRMATEMDQTVTE